VSTFCCGHHVCSVVFLSELLQSEVVAERRMELWLQFRNSGVEHQYLGVYLADLVWKNVGKALGGSWMA